MIFQVSSIKKARVNRKVIDLVTPIVTLKRDDTISCETPQKPTNLPPRPPKLEYSLLTDRSKRKRNMSYAQRTVDFIENMLTADGLGEGSSVEVKCLNYHF